MSPRAKGKKGKLRLLGNRAPLKVSITKKPPGSHVDVKRLSIQMLDGLRKTLEETPDGFDFDAVQQLIRQRAGALRFAIDQVEGKPSEELHPNAPFQIRLWSPAEGKPPEQVLLCVDMADGRVFSIRLRTKEGTAAFIRDLTGAAREVWGE